MKKTLTTNTKAAAAPQLEQPAAGITPRRQMLRTTDLKRPEDGPPNLNLAGGRRTTEADDKTFIGFNATTEELADLRARIEARQRPPAPSQVEEPQIILVCTNQKCRAWASYEAKHVPRALGSCIFCNYRNLKDGGQMRRASEAETTLFWSEKRRLQELGKLRAKQAQESELERRRLGIHLMVDNLAGPSIAADMTIKKGRG